MRKRNIPDDSSPCLRYDIHTLLWTAICKGFLVSSHGGNKRARKGRMGEGEFSPFSWYHLDP